MAMNKQQKKEYGKKKDEENRQRWFENLADGIRTNNLPWQKPWVGGGGGIPMNLKSKKAYRGGNVITLWVYGMGEGWTDLRFGTRKQLIDAGENVEEKVWRMPLHKNYDKLMDSKIADMQNINYVGGAGSTTAAQFLQRFVINKTPWAHLDIAGMAFSKYGGAINPSGATGYGVRLLNQFVEDNYE